MATPDTDRPADHARRPDAGPAGSHGHGHDPGPGHDHAHGHAPGHGHAPSVGPANERRVAIAALITGSFMLAEAVGGVISGSLALIADAGHMLTDFASLGLAWLGFRMARRPADARRTYGFDRLQILAAFTNGIALFFIAGWIAVEAVGRLIDPVAILGGTMLGIAVAGLAFNIAAFLVLHGADRENLNIRGALIHVLGDLLGSVAAIAAALVIVLTGWVPIDPILSLLVAAILVRSAVLVTREAGHILLEGAPRDRDVEAIKTDLREHIRGLAAVEHVHLWSLTQSRQMATMHLLLDGTRPQAEVVARVRHRLDDRFGIGHATIEVTAGEAGEAAR